MKKNDIKFVRFQKAVRTLESICLEPAMENRMSTDATIKRFEYTFESAWKFLKEYFRDQGTELNFPKEILKEAFASGLINNEALWIKMLSDRNMTSHTYNDALADEIYGRIKKNYVSELKKLVETALKLCH